MGSCISEPSGASSRRVPNLTNPIKMTVSSKSIELLRAKWDRTQLQLLEGKVSTLVGTALPFERFLQVFPKLAGLSAPTQRKYFQLLAYEGNQDISRKQLMNALTIIKKVEDTRFLAPLIYYVYTAEPGQPFMTDQEFLLFQEENKAYANNLENLDDHEVQGEGEIEVQELEVEGEAEGGSGIQNGSGTQNSHAAQNGHGKPSSKPQPIPSNPSLMVLSSNGSPPPSRKRLITLSEFQKIFSGYSLQHYQILFSWSLPEQQQELVSVFLKEGASRRKGDKVFLVEYQWFLCWKAYAEQEYQVRIDLKEAEAELNYLSTKSANRRKSKEDVRLQSPSSLKLQGKAEKPGQIRNFVLKSGRRDNELVQNMRELYHYICVKEQVWRRMVAIYNGGPAIERIYPKIYYNVIIKVAVQANGRFIPRSTRRIESKERPTVSGYAQPNQLPHACFYKYPGKKNWKELQNVSTNSQEIFNGPKTYLVFVPRTAVSTFTSLYNIRQSKDKKYLKERFANYGTQVNFSIDGVMNRGEVVQIQDGNSITVEYTDEQGNVRRRAIVNDDDFEKFNPENLMEEAQLNELSGLDNIGNTCYMNAVIQCLIRTPFFGSYLEQENFADALGDQLLVQEIARIYIKSKTNSHASINTKPFKRLFQKHCPFFQGNSQHDSQQFLLCFLQRLMEEINSKKEEFGVSSQVVKRTALDEDKNANKKVVKFFSGKTEAVTMCKKCRNKGVRVESFFTYSLSLPQQPVAQFYYYFVPLYKQQANTSLTPLLCGITMKRKATVEDFISAVAKQRRVRDRNLALYTVFNNEILNRLEGSCFHKEIGYYLHFNAKLVCFYVENEDTPTFYDYQRRQLKGKSVKIQLRQRIYSEKNQEYKVIYQPFILQVTEGMFWKDLQQDIKTVLEKLQPKKEDSVQTPYNPSHIVTPDKAIGLSQIKFSASTLKHASSLNETPVSFGKNSQSLIRNSYQASPVSPHPAGTVLSSSSAQSYKIRVVKSDHVYQNSCVFCKQDFMTQKRSFSKRTCKGCTFDPSTMLLQQAQFRNISDNIIITVDWQQSIPEFQKFTKDESYDYCMQMAESRKDVLKDLLTNNFNNAEELQLRCEKEGCQHGFASRTEKITIYPNILLLHLKRFTYEDNMLVKLTNSVLYPETLELPSETYELYGVVAHIGSGAGGHYISFVKVAGKWYKCDDNRVRLAGKGQHIDPNAYLLFYKRRDFEPGLMTLSF